MSESKTIPDGVDKATAMAAIAWEITLEAMKFQTTEEDLKMTPESYINKITALYRKSFNQLKTEPRGI
jgi:hypothetical protein